jgi:hypothetical protein
MTVRDSNWVLVVKCVWLAANLTGWLMGLGSCATEPNCWLATNNLLPILFLLSFPGSLFFLIVNEVLLEIGVIVDASPAMHYTFLSLGAIATGYIQWFHVLPALFGKQGITVLALNQPITTSTGEQQIPRKPSRRAQVKAAQAPPFDSAGRSPLERVINRRLRRRPTDSS